MTIRFALPIHPERGYTVAISCPVIVCDACTKIIDTAHSGNLLWDDQQQFHVHKGACDQALDPQHLMLSEEISVWVQQLAHNHDHPLIGSTIDEVGITVRQVQYEPGL